MRDFVRYIQIYLSILSLLLLLLYKNSTGIKHSLQPNALLDENLIVSIGANVTFECNISNFDDFANAENKINESKWLWKWKSSVSSHKIIKSALENCICITSLNCRVSYILYITYEYMHNFLQRLWLISFHSFCNFENGTFNKRSQNKAIHEALRNFFAGYKQISVKWLSPKSLFFLALSFF